MYYHYNRAVFLVPRILLRNGSTKNGTVHEAEMLATIRNWLYLCSAFETQVQNVEY